VRLFHSLLHTGSSRRTNQPITLSISTQAPTPDYKRNGDCEPAVYFLEKSSSAADEGFRLIVNPDAPAKYLVCANPPVDTTTIVPNLIAVTSDCLD
jgi:hypothetical protein